MSTVVFCRGGKAYHLVDPECERILAIAGQSIVHSRLSRVKEQRSPNHRAVGRITFQTMKRKDVVGHAQAALSMEGETR